MRKIIVTGLILLMAGTSASVVWAASSNDNTIAVRQTFVNDVTDYFSTIGKSEQEKAQLIRQRKALRRAERLESLEARRNAAVRKKMKQQEKIMMNKINAPYSK